MTQPKHPKNDFMIERIAFFSDAVFAIAITLLAIEIHPPLVKKGETSADVMGHFKEIVPELVGLVVSFWLIATVWLRHHSLFKYVDNFDLRFVSVNLWLLFTIILFPFSTSFLFSSIFSGAVTKLQVFCYLGVPLCSNLIMFFLYKRVKNKHLKGQADVRYHQSLASQVGIIGSFTLVIIWVAILPLEYHPFGYAFFAASPLITKLYKRLQTK